MDSKNDVYRGEDCITKFCEGLREKAMKIINFKKRKMVPLTNKLQESYEKTKSATLTKEV